MGNHWRHVLQGLTLLLDEALADRIVEMERLKTANARINLHESEDCYMCLMPGCRKPVVGKWIFAHCSDHLEAYEQHWLEEKIESTPCKATDEADHPAVKMVKELRLNRNKELAQENALKQEKALTEAYNLLRNTQILQRERRSYLPQELLDRIERNAADQAKIIGYPPDR